MGQIIMGKYKYYRTYAQYGNINIDTGSQKEIFYNILDLHSQKTEFYLTSASYRLRVGASVFQVEPKVLRTREVNDVNSSLKTED